MAEISDELADTGPDRGALINNRIIESAGRDPAVQARESTPVKSTTAVGHSADRASRVTCCDANAVSLATEICGLFFRASCSASFIERVTGAVVLTRRGR